MGMILFTLSLSQGGMLIWPKLEMQVPVLPPPIPAVNCRFMMCPIPPVLFLWEGPVMGMRMLMLFLSQAGMLIWGKIQIPELVLLLLTLVVNSRFMMFLTHQTLYMWEGRILWGTYLVFFLYLSQAGMCT